MDFDFWKDKYLGWEVKRLLDEIGNCHLYQQDLYFRVADGQCDAAHAVRLAITSQLRENIIVEVLTEKSKNA